MASTAAFAAFAVVGLFASLGPPFVTGLLKVSNHAVGGAVVFTLLATSAATQLLCRGWAAHRALLVGLAALVIGLVGLVGAIPVASLPLFALGTAVAGAGQGLAYLGAQKLVDAAATPATRTATFSTFYMVLYLAGSFAALGVGFGTPVLGFHQAVLLFSAIIVAIGLLGLAWALLDRAVFAEAKAA